MNRLQDPDDLFEPVETPAGLHWPDVRDWLLRHGQTLREDRALLEEIGLKPHGRNVIEFGPAALTRLEAAAMRESDARKRIEAVTQANFAAQTQTHAAALELLQARNLSDLARRLDTLSRDRFGLVGARVALETPGGIPFGWKSLAPGQVDRWLGEDGLGRLGHAPADLAMFEGGDDNAAIGSVALIRMCPVFPSSEDGARPGLCAFASREAEGFTPDMGHELVAFLTKVLERTAERWPILA